MFIAAMFQNRAKYDFPNADVKAINFAFDKSMRTRVSPLITYRLEKDRAFPPSLREALIDSSPKSLK